MTDYDLGTRIRLSITNIRDTAGVLTDPDLVECDLTDPAGALTHPEVTREGEGSYSAEVTPAAHGLWRYGFRCTGIEVAAQSTFNVRRWRADAAIEDVAS